MKTILISIIILWFNIGGHSQDCLSDVVRYGHFNEMKVLNNQSGKYEKFTKAKETSLQVTIISEKKTIKFIDRINNYDKTFHINGCLMSENDLTYLCIDLDNERNCSLIFSATDSTYDLTVYYEVAPVVYKVSRIKYANQ